MVSADSEVPVVSVALKIFLICSEVHSEEVLAEAETREEATSREKEKICRKQLRSLLRKLLLVQRRRSGSTNMLHVKLVMAKERNLELLRKLVRNAVAADRSARCRELRLDSSSQ